VGEIQRALCVGVLSLLSLNACSITLLTEHAIKVSQAVSAFYMYSLTEGDDRYHDEYTNVLAQAHMSFLALKKQNPKQVTELESLWMGIQKEKNYKPRPEDDYNVAAFLRVDFRNYMEKVYLQVSRSIGSPRDLDEQMSLIVLDVEVMSARFFDVSSATLGMFTLPSKVLTIDPPLLAQKMKQRLARLQANVVNAKIDKNLKLVLSKWRFIEGGVIDYQQESAYMLVYYNKNRIGSLINHSQGILANL